MIRPTNKTRPPAMECPHCGGKADIRTSKAMTATYREVSYRCQNDACGCQFVAGLETIRITVQSAQPNPEIRVPFSSRVRGMPPIRPANDDMPAPANDDAARGAAEPMTDTG